MIKKTLILETTIKKKVDYMKEEMTPQEKLAAKQQLLNQPQQQQVVQPVSDVECNKNAYCVVKMGEEWCLFRIKFNPEAKQSGAVEIVFKDTTRHVVEQKYMVETYKEGI